MRPTNGLLLICLLLLAAGALHCAGGAEDTADPAAHDAEAAGHGQTVAWFEGTVDEAFALGLEEDRPLFLYWGAEWCPPCHYLKTKVFKTPAFAAKIREFIPIYLDGDTERAQILGERFGAMGYPTVIIFSPQGEEIMRMPSDVSAERYVELLDTALGRMRPIQDVLTAVLESGPASAPAEDLNLLAFYSWGQDTQIELEAEELFSTIQTLYRETPDELSLEKSRFLSMYLDELTSAAGDAEEGEDAAPALADAERASLREAVLALLQDPERSNVNLFFVFFGTDTVELLYPEPSAQREALLREWDAAARRIENDESLSIDDRLSASYPRLQLARLQAGAGEEEEVALPQELTDHVRQRVAWAGEAVTDDGEMQTVMSTMVSLLEESGAADEAEALLQARMGDAHAPYYFMSWMASLKRDADDPEEALVWYRKAYDSSRGNYTRFRWGSTYLRRLLDLNPEDTTTIDEDSREILTELLHHEDAFAGGNASRLRQLASAYEAWNEDGANETTVAGIRDLVHAECERYPMDGEDSQRERCQSFLAE